ncbi:hypothetical protein Dimus_009062 [Dionaea muscipula]
MEHCRIDSLSVLPSSFGPQDVSKVLSLCPTVQSTLKSNRAIILGESYVLSECFVKDVFTCMEKEMQTFQEVGSVTETLGGDKNSVKESKSENNSSQLSDLNESSVESRSNKVGMEKVSRKKKGRSTRSSAVLFDDDNQDSVPAKSKKSQRRGKETSSSHVSGSKTTKEDVGVPSEEWIICKICVLVPEFEEHGIDDPEIILKPLAKHLRPMLFSSWSESRKTLFAEKVDRMRLLLDTLQKKIDESFLNIQLYEKALDLFEDDKSTAILLHRHLLRTTAALVVDVLLLNLDVYNKLKNGIEVQESQNPESLSLSQGERINIAKGLEGSLSVKAVALVESLEGKCVETFMTALAAVAEESGLLLKKLDKKLERTLLHSYRKDLTLQVSSETDPVSLLPKVVSLLYLKAYNKALQAPGRAISVAVSHLKVWHLAQF